MRPNRRSVIWKIHKSCICQFSITGLFLSVDFHGCRNCSQDWWGIWLQRHYIHWTDLLLETSELHSPNSLSWKSQILLNFTGSVDALPPSTSRLWRARSVWHWVWRSLIIFSCRSPAAQGHVVWALLRSLWLFLLCTTSTPPGAVFALLAQTKTEQRESQCRSKETPLW